MPTETQIQDNVVETVAAAAGVASAQAWQQRDNTYANLPAVIVRHARSVRLDEHTAGEDWRTWFHLHVLVDHDITDDPLATDQILSGLFEEIRRVLYTDRTRGDLALETDCLEELSVGPTTGQRFAERVVVVAVMWRLDLVAMVPPPPVSGRFTYDDFTAVTGNTFTLSYDPQADELVELYLTGVSLYRRTAPGAPEVGQFTLAARNIVMGGASKLAGETLIARYPRAA